MADDPLRLFRQAVDGAGAPLSDDDEYRRDTLDLDAHRRQQTHLIGLCCEHCGGQFGDPRSRFMAGHYLDLYIRSGLPTKTAAFALLMIGVSYLADTAYFVYVWALEVYARWGGPARTLTERLS